MSQAHIAEGMHQFEEGVFVVEEGVGEGAKRVQ
jgi:predicted transcriptional regulator